MPCVSHLTNILRPLAQYDAIQSQFLLAADGLITQCSRPRPTNCKLDDPGIDDRKANADLVAGTGRRCPLKYVYHIITQKWYYFSFHLSQLDVPWLHLFRLSQNPSSTCPTVVLGT
jgi:hypothetical protein